MICTFGDITDVTWWRELGLPRARDRPARRDDRPASLGRAGMGDARRRVGAPRARRARRAPVSPGARGGSPSCWPESGHLVGEPKPVRHVVKFYEKGERPLEVVSSRQWFVKTLEYRERLLERGRELRWHPRHMGARYASWVEGLNGDWCISRQRFFGVPFPVWYPLDERGRPGPRPPAAPRRGPAPGRPDLGRPRRLRGGGAGQARRLRRRSRHHGHVGDVLAHAADRRRGGRTTPTCSPASSRWTCARRRTTSSGPGSSTRSSRPSSSTAPCRGRTRRSAASSSTRTARRCPSPRATS